jgi:hypothetical protein
MITMKYAPVLLTLALISAIGALHGAVSDRWVRSTQLQKSIEALKSVPLRFGDWEGHDLAKDDELTRLGIQASLFRHYKNKVNQQEVRMMLMCGRGGPICVHTPDVCYSGAGYKQLGDERRVVIESVQKDEFTVARFS